MEDNFNMDFSEDEERIAKVPTKSGGGGGKPIENQSTQLLKHLVNKNRGKIRTHYELLEVLVPNAIESLPYIKLKRWVQVD